MSTHQLIPSDYQIPLPLKRFIVSKSPASKEVLTQDVLFIGAGPAGLAGAIELANLVRLERQQNLEFPALEIGVLEKAKMLGGHCLSGAIIDPSSLLRLFPNLAEKDFPFREKVTSEAVYWLTKDYSQALPVPPAMHNKGNYLTSVCELVRWLGGKAEALGVNIFTGFAAESLIENEIGKIIGVRTTAGGLIA
jgi:electron-transferring-flavoprotein dehydrogenase